MPCNNKKKEHSKTCPTADISHHVAVEDLKFRRITENSPPIIAIAGDVPNAMVTGGPNETEIAWPKLPQLKELFPESAIMEPFPGRRPRTLRNRGDAGGFLEESET
jgi:hypothetical protein